MKLPSVALLALVGALPCSLASFCGEGSSRIFCENGGLCRSGRADFSSYQLDDGSYHDVHDPVNDQVYCECDPDAWTGIDCSVPIENCADGVHFCLYGGNCIADGSTQSLYCDCSAAIDEDGNRYVGKWCEHQELNHCDPDGDRHTFCLHGGVCNPEFPFDGPPCECESGFDGPHCEYQVENALPDCTLDCQNGGVCKLGSGVGLVDEYQYFESDNDTSEDYMYCDCPPGRHGPLCQVDSVPCGDDRCYNGGECIEREFEGKTISHCNCNTATDKDTRFAGKFCQYPSTEICTNSGSLEGKLFCVNGGRCQADPYLGCDCNEGFDGFACEFRITTVDDDTDDYYDDDADDYYDDDGDDGGSPAIQPTTPGFDLPEAAHCELQCNGHGTCRKGVKDIASLGIAAQGNYLNETHTDEFEHCVCDDGFVGLQCEHEVQVCGENDEEPEHFCLHGGSCVRIEEEGFVCDCSTASGDLGEIFFGKHCQHPATACVEPADPNGSFCANGGVCIENAGSDKTHAGCDCAPGWTGEFCTVWTLSSFSWEDEDRSTTRERNTARVVILVLFLVSVGTAGTFAAVKYANRRRYFKESSFGSALESARADSPDDQTENLAPYASSSSRDPMAEMAGTSPDEESYSELFMGPPQDDDGHELHDVGIV